MASVVNHLMLPSPAASNSNCDPIELVPIAASMNDNYHRVHGVLRECCRWVLLRGKGRWMWVVYGLRVSFCEGERDDGFGCEGLRRCLCGCGETRLYVLMPQLQKQLSAAFVSAVKF